MPNVIADLPWLLVKDGARSMEHGALEKSKSFMKKSILHILLLLITNFRLLRVREIGYYPYKGNRILMFSRVSVSELGKGV